MKRLRVLLAEMQPMLREIVRDSLAREPDIEIVGDFEAREEVFRNIRGVDVAIIGAQEPEDSALARDVLRTSPSTRVLAIAMSGRTAILWQLRPYRVPLGDVSPESLVRAIRANGENGISNERGADRGVAR